MLDKALTRYVGNADPLAFAARYINLTYNCLPYIAIGSDSELARLAANAQDRTNGRILPRKTVATD